MIFLVKLLLDNNRFSTKISKIPTTMPTKNMAANPKITTDELIPINVYLVSVPSKAAYSTIPNTTPFNNQIIPNGIILSIFLFVLGVSI